MRFSDARFTPEADAFPFSGEYVEKRFGDA
jgi:hypothetical protein